MEYSVKDRLKLFLRDSNIKAVDFCKLIEVSSGFISGMRESVQPDKLKSIAIKYPDLSIGWLMTGIGNMSKSNAVSVVQDTNGIPLYRVEAAAGFGNSNFCIDETDIEARYKIKELESCTFMLHVRGDSMMPTYNNGDIVAVQVVTDFRKIQWGKPHLISSTGDGMLIKRIYDDEGDIVAVSDNPTYKPIHITKDEISGVAIVKGCVKFEN